MKYKNFDEVIENFNNRYGQTEIFLDPEKNELKLLYDGVLGDINESDIKVFDKTMKDSLERKLLQEALSGF